jgi:hypothetical protein
MSNGGTMNTTTRWLLNRMYVIVGGAILLGALALTLAQRLGHVAVDPTTEAKVTASHDAKIDYRGDLNRWVVGGHVVPVACPEEDSCEVQRIDDVVWIYRAAS